LLVIAGQDFAAEGVVLPRRRENLDPVALTALPSVRSSVTCGAYPPQLPYRQ